MNELSSLGPRDLSHAGADARAYSRLVGFLRCFLPLVVIAGLGLLWMWSKEKENIVQTVTTAPNLMVEGLRLTGRDAQGRTYALTAQQAAQSAGFGDAIELESPRGEIVLDDGSWFVGSATKGHYDQKAEKLWLSGGVEFFQDKGGRLILQDLAIDMKKRLAWSKKPVIFQGDFGILQGQGLEVLGDGNIIVFTGPAKARLQLFGKMEQDKPSVNDSRAP